MPLTWRAFHLPKRGHVADEYEDAFAANAATGRFAVADGASESSFAARWARLLVEGFVQRKQRGTPGRGGLGTLRQRWAIAVDGHELPWYAEAKRQEGAFATFLGLSFRRTGEVWRAVAVGDSCLFQVRRGALIRSFPLMRAADFDNRPSLLGSRQAAVVARQRCRGNWEPGDRFFLATDALAQWLLTRQEAGEGAWEALANLPPDAAGQAAFAAWVANLRARDGLRNDDVTLLAIEVQRDS